MPRPQVQRILEEPGVVGAHIEVERQRAQRVNAGTGRVQRGLPDRNPHPANPLVADPENRFVVGHDDDLRIIVACVPERVDHVAAIGGRDEDSARAPVNVAVVLAHFADCRRVDDRHHLFEMVEHQPVKQGLVAISQRVEEQIFTDVVAGLQEVVVDARLLFDRCRDSGRYDAAQAQLFSLLEAEAGAFIENRVFGQRRSAAEDRQILLAVTIGSFFEPLRHWRASGGT